MGALLTIHVLDDPPTIQLDGEVDLSTVDEFRSAIDQSLAKGHGLTVDLSDVSFIDSTGLGLICETAVKMNGDGPLVLKNPSQVARMVLEIFGVSRISSLKIEG